MQIKLSLKEFTQLLGEAAPRDKVLTAVRVGKRQVTFMFSPTEEDQMGMMLIRINHVQYLTPGGTWPRRYLIDGLSVWKKGKVTWQFRYKDHEFALAPGEKKKGDRHAWYIIEKSCGAAAATGPTWQNCIADFEFKMRNQYKDLPHLIYQFEVRLATPKDIVEPHLLMVL